MVVRRLGATCVTLCARRPRCCGLKVVWLPSGRPAHIANRFAQGARRLQVSPYLLPFHGGQACGILRVRLADQPVPDRLYFRFIGAQQAVDTNKHIGIVFVNILRINAIVYAVGRGCVQEPLGNPESGHNLGMTNNTPESRYRADNHNDGGI